MTIAVPKEAHPRKALNFSGRKQLPLIMQTEDAECGLACLGMLVGYHGYDIDITNLRRRFKISNKGLSLKDVMSMASIMKLAPRAVRVEPENLHHIKLPCIVHWNFSHFVVLKDINKEKVTIHDPALGIRRIKRSEFNEKFTGIALELTPTSDFTKGEEKQELTLSYFWSNASGLKRTLVQILILSLLLQIFILVGPFYLQTIVDDVLLRKDVNLLTALAIGFGLLTLVQLGTGIVRELIIMRVSNQLAMQMSSSFFYHLIRLPMSYFEKRHMGDIVSRFSSLSKIRELLSYGIVAAIIDGILASITLVAMFIYDKRLALIVLSIVSIYAIIRWIFYRPLKTLTEEGMIASAKENTHFMESIRAIQTIKLFQREDDRHAQWQNHLVDAMNKNIQIAKWNINYNTINSFLFGFENLIVIYFAAVLVMENSISVGMLFAFISYKSSFISAMDGLINKGIEYKMLNIHLARLADIAFTAPESNQTYPSFGVREDGNRNDPIMSDSNESSAGEIAIKNLSYRYGEQEPYIFEGINFVISPGETIAITGPSGCGKTTLLKCLMGLLLPTEGEITIDGRPIGDCDGYRARIAGVMQESQLLAGDIAENISCFSPSIDMERVRWAAKMACIDDEIMRMPMRYETLVGDMGSVLSGGQKQRIILARALYYDPQILFLDEATSHLDVENETLVNDNIRSLNITRIMVAHRPETIAIADRHLSMEDARKTNR